MSDEPAEDQANRRRYWLPEDKSLWNEDVSPMSAVIGQSANKKPRRTNTEVVAELRAQLEEIIAKREAAGRPPLPPDIQAKLAELFARQAGTDKQPVDDDAFIASFGDWEPEGDGEH